MMGELASNKVYERDKWMICCKTYVTMYPTDYWYFV